MCPGNWEYLKVVEAGVVQAAMPVHFKKSRHGIRTISQPQLTATLGPILSPPTGKYYRQLSTQMDQMKALIELLPEADQIELSFHHSLTNWLPFYWQKFQCTTSYTYILDDISSSEHIWEGIKDNIRGDIKKASKQLVLRDDLGVDEFYRVYSLTFLRQGMPVPVSLELLKKLSDEVRSRNTGQMYFAVDSSKKVHAVVFIVWHGSTAYYILGGGDPELRKSGAHSFVIWEALKLLSSQVKSFDFEGSMKPSIEQFFRAFGARQAPILSVTKENRKFQAFKLLQGTRHKFRSLLK